jgi:choice-of-anchor B domain-containing protein
MFFNTTKGPLSITGIFCLFFLNFHLFAQSPTVNMQVRSRMTLLGQDGSNICGYAANGREYALVGTSGGSMIVDVTNPDVPKLIRQIPATNSIWREIKVYRNFAYITTEAGGVGLQIVDLSRLPDSAGVTVTVFKSDTARGLANLNRTHALHIDTTKGFCYLFGGGHTLTTGGTIRGATVFDIKTDPLNPRYVGNYNQKYIHDGYVDNDTMYACHIENGNFSVIDFRNKTAPITLSTTTTPTAYTHNSWLNSTKKAVFTTDENCGSYLGSYDISNPQDPKLLDKIRSISEENAIIHNTHVRDDYAVTSWYTEGVIITDVHRPQNLVHVAQYDAVNGTLPAQEGTWGAYPFLPSGNIILSNITPGELIVLTPQYKRASYLEGTITDAANGQVLSGVRVKINSSDMDKQATSTLTGSYATGQVTTGNFTVTYSKKGYAPQTVTVTFASGVVKVQNISLRPAINYTQTGTITALTGGAVLGDVQVLYKNEFEEFSTRTTVQGNYSLVVPESDYDIYVGDWGVQSKYLGKRSITSNGTLSTQLQRGYYDDFWAESGWRILGNATAGAWIRGISVQANNIFTITQPRGDSPTDNDNLSYFTANGTCSSGPGVADVDGGVTTLISKPMKIRNYTDPQLTFNYWFHNSGGTGTPNDALAIVLNNGLRDTTIFTQTLSASAWRASPILKIKNYLPLTDSMTVTFQAFDSDPGHLVEAALDNFRLIDLALPNAVQNFAETWKLTAYPNPFTQSLSIDYQLDKTSKNAEIKVLNALGQVVEAKKVLYTEGSFSIGFGLPTGVYFVKIEAEGKVSKAIRVVKN